MLDARFDRARRWRPETAPREPQREDSQEAAPEAEPDVASLYQELQRLEAESARIELRRTEVLARPRVMVWLRRFFAASFCALGLKLALT